jgi:hypothetical protein
MAVLPRIALIAALLPVPFAAQADAVSDALDAAAAAYAAGDLPTTSASLTMASQQLATLQSNLLLAKFPAAPEGWTRTDNADMAAGMAVMGGGAGGEVTYVAPDGSSVAVSAYADNMMVQSFAGLLTDPAMIAMMGKTVEINGVTFLEQEGNSMMALLENRVLLQANGDATKAQQILALFDLAALAAFDKQ